MSCSRCKYKRRGINETPCSNCKHAYTSKFVPMTNYDKVKEMSVDELAEFLNKITAGRKQVDQLYKTVFGKDSVNFNAKQSIKEWLESEAKADG